MDRELVSQIRTEIAVKMVMAKPVLFHYATDARAVVLEKKDQVQTRILKSLMKMGPRIKPILAYYQKRERWSQ